MAATPTGQTLSTLETSTRRLIEEEDSTNSNFSTAEIYDYINEGLRRLATKLEWQLAIFTATTVQNQTTYTIPAHMIDIVDVYFNNILLIMVDRAEMSNVNSQWLGESAGQPKYAYKADRNKIGLFPKPDASNAGLELRMQGIKLPDNMSVSTDSPDIHYSLHDALPYFAAFRCEMKAGNNQRAADFLKLFQNGIADIQAQLDKFADGLLGFRFDGKFYPDEPRTL